MYISFSCKSFCLLLILTLGFVSCLDNGLGLTPPMGWNSWNHFGCNITEQIIKEMADKLVSSGLAAKGYTYLNIDDCWQDKQKFPSGMASLANYIHQKGLKFGLYSDAGTQTCQGRPGSYNYQQIDADTYAKWGYLIHQTNLRVDYLKYDNCHNQGIPAKFRYPVMRDALNKTGRPIYFSMCQWGYSRPQTWAQPVANSWRTTLDLVDNWYSFLLTLTQQEGKAKFAGPGAWNDPDMLQVGNGGMDNDQYQTHFALWAALKAPLLIGCNLANMSKQTLDILSNEELIQINQDPLGKQAQMLDRVNMSVIQITQVWGSQISNNRFVYVFFNLHGFKQTVTYNFRKHNTNKITKVRDLILHEDVQFSNDHDFKSRIIAGHSVGVYLVSFDGPINGGNDKEKKAISNPHPSLQQE